VSRVLCR